MKNISLKNTKTHNSGEKKLINFNKTSNKLSIFKEILLSLKNSGNNNDAKDKDLLKLEKYIKIDDNINTSDENFISNSKNLDINDIDSKNDGLKSDSFIVDISNINNSGFRINDSLINKKEISNLKNLNSLINQKEKLNNTVDQKVKVLQKNLLSQLKIFENVEKERAINEIKEAKSIGEILNIAKKYKLNLKSVDIKKEDFDKEKKSNNKELTFKETTKIVLEEKEIVLKKKEQFLHHKFQSLNTKSKYNKDIQENEKKNDITLNVLLQKNSKTKDEKRESKKDNIKLDLNLKKLDNKLDNKIIDESSKILDEKKRVNLNSEKSVVEIKSNLVDKTDKKDLDSNEKVDLTKTERVVGFEEVTKPNEMIKQKVIDAKQMVLSFAKTLQEQVENYKPPFTRMQLSLDPQDLGKVDVTLISRGKNLHIQVNSNPTAIGVMAVQGNELKNQLNSMGFTDVQMQFNMSQQQQQQQQNSKRQMYSSKEYIDIDEIPENYESLEIIIPNYA